MALSRVLYWYLVMNDTPRQLTVTCGSAQLCFLVGRFNDVVANILHSNSPHGQVILPCTLYDLARVTNEPEIARAYQEVDFCTTDGMPLVWWFRSRTRDRDIERVYGPDILATVFDQTNNQKHTILCSNQEIFEKLTDRFAAQIKKKTVQLIVVGESRATEERQRLAAAITKFQPRFVWIGVGSPNQVLLATALRDAIKKPITYWCVGAAIPFLAGTVQQAPRWMQQNGLEWLFRLFAEPRRLWQRYLVITPQFLLRLLFAKIKSA